MRIYSTDFENNGEIPVRCTQEGEDLSPELVFEDVPVDAKSLVLISDDPDAPDPAAPKRIWLHWIVVNLPADCKKLDCGVKEMPAGSVTGKNDSGVVGWSGPLPPIGRHRYYFKLYALDTSLSLPTGFTRAQAEATMQGHVIAQAQCMGTYIHSKNR